MKKIIKILYTVIVSAVLVTTNLVDSSAAALPVNIAFSDNDRSIEMEDQLISEYQDAMQGIEFKYVLHTFVSEYGIEHDEWRKDIKNAYFGEIVIIPTVTEKGCEGGNIGFCPIVVDGKIIAAVSFSKSDYDVFYQFGLQYIDVLNKAAKIQKKCYFYDGKMRINYDSDVSVDYVERNKYINGTISEILGEPSVQSVISTSTGAYLSNFPYFYQGDDPICWACSIASMVKYELPSSWSSITPSNVVSRASLLAYGNSPGTWNNIMATFGFYFGSPYVPTLLNTYMTKYQIMTTINNNDPALIAAVCGSAAHHVVLKGYNQSGTYFSVRFVNSAISLADGGSDCWSNYSVNGPWSFNSGGYSYTWDKTVRLLYSN